MSLKASLAAEEREKELLRLMTPEMIEQMVQKKVEEILANYVPTVQAQAGRKTEEVKVMA